MKHKLIDRIHDRAWREVGQRLAQSPSYSSSETVRAISSSISSTMPWAEVCSAFVNGSLGSENFRRNSAVRDIVETVGPADGKFYARRILEWNRKWLSDSRIEKIDNWGNPIRWPGFLLGTTRAFSPTTLRYLATALWLKKSGHLKDGMRVVEIGVGFGGLAAMNALVSGAVTVLVDLPQVEHLVLRMLNENSLQGYGIASATSNHSDTNYAVSNYAFTELSAKLQTEYFDRYLKNAPHGMIISNSSVFADSIRGRSDAELIKWFRDEGLDAKLEVDHELLGPGDHLCGVRLIHW